MKIRYVVGFAFSLDKSKVMLIRKQKPEFQRGYLNGIGGKIELGETPQQAMDREGLEESGLQINWIYKGYMSGLNNDDSLFECHIFYAYSDMIFDFIQIESEKIGLYTVDELNKEKILENLKYLIPYGSCKDNSTLITISY